ncbi:uncharacterized protein MONOS_18414 [Monocercomonoides exilis]|uniref:uncharacterized protein n=1 Tax=Monocercomonoides exilis TaxID=2049356 RepID=UPI00355A3471|nr:hypothetical protein MONOS_18400 [Monocercomonoides exilis]KAH7814798.1 hypothetical protein MONOS_18402 [Monocercomonoides exilis]KAH7814800.1 hypothetical protein MONOS_18404 [Monocercomonoides exilis]KAH7814802.1 hypothetical protein MONOS_18406 [Monocercomonoides exilis]KAH7814804.1 hypothetical protein MONOS_18408 [Monocercomonoides exilis]
MAFNIDNDDWLGDIPLSRKAFIEDVDVMWAPRWTRAWKMQMENIDWYMERCNEVVAKCLEEFNVLWRILTIRNRKRPRALRRVAILPYSSTAATLARNVTNIARPAARLVKYAGGSGLIRGAATALWQWHNRRKLYSTIRKAGQGRVPNWKQVKQTGTGIKIRRRRRRGRRLRRRLRRRYRIRKRRYFNWLYKNRPIDYRSTQGATGVIYMYNMTMSSGGSLNYPSGSITYININGTMPSYVKGFKRTWLANLNAQLFMDKLLRISADTNWVTQFHFNIYPNMKTLWTQETEPNRCASQSAQCTLSYKYDQVNYFSQGTRPNAIVKESEEVSGGIGNEPRGGSSATGSTPGPSSSFTILHDDN